MKHGILLLTGLLILPGIIAADELKKRYTRSADAMAAPENLGWSGSISLGAVVTSGNSDTSNLSIDTTARLNREKWRHRFDASATMAENNGTKTTERYLAGYKIDYKMDQRSYLFTALRAEFDKFSGFDQQLSAAVGYGYRVIDTTADTLDLEIGAGIRRNKYDNGDTESENVGRAALDYIHHFNETARFRQGILVMGGENNVSVDSVTAIRTNLVSSVAMEAAFKIKYNSEPIGDKEETDTITSLSLVYGF